MNIITGYTGTPHITSAQDRDANQGSYGEASYILDVGNKMAATIVSANEIRIGDGILSHQGCLGSIDKGLYDSVAISSGTQGMKRSDLIVCRYTKESGTNIEALSLVVIEGTPAASNPSDPSYNQGNIQSGDSPVDFPLYRVNINGVNVTGVTRVAPYVMTQAEISTLLGSTAVTIGGGTVTGALSTLNGRTTFLSQKVTSFYDARCENIAAGEETYLLKFGSVHVAVICVKMKKTLTSSQTSIINLPSGFNVPNGYQPWGIIYNRTTGKVYQMNISGAGNINILNRGELAIGDNLLGEIVWMA